ncbi:MAG: flavin reductase family protein [Candidatus Bathyarchaeia archaeon]
MNRRKVDLLDFIEETYRIMRGHGLFLVSAGRGGRPNAMTIGWGLLGTMWREPFLAVAVRRSRYTHGLIEESGEFTVCLPGRGMERMLEFCGSRSGRELDKFKELGMTAVRGISIGTPYIGECPVHFECRVAYKVDVKEGQLDPAMEREIYPRGDFHTIYYGRVLGVYAEEDAEDRLLS